jgi:hypothetical protein
MTLLPWLQILLGATVVVVGVGRHRRGLRLPLTTSAASLPLASALRAVLVGGACVAAGIGWIAGSRTIVGLACVIGAEELLETSVVIAALRAQTRVRDAEPVRGG